MSFSDPRWLWMLWVLPLAAMLELITARQVKARLKLLVGERPNHPLLAARLERERLIGAVLRIAALGCLVIGAAGPEWGREVVRRGSTGSDVVLLVDVSASMDTRDVPPSRMDEARREALAVLDRLYGSRVGVVAFAGDAVRLCPLTLDVPAARLVVEALSSGSISTPGTDLGKGLRAALKVMPQGRREEQAIVVWTDGEDLEHGARAAIDEVARSGIRVLTIGLGTREGDVVPVLDADGSMTDVKRDERGNAVRSRLDEGLLRSMAQRTHGAYFAANRPGGELGRLLGALDNLARSGRRQRLVERPVPRFTLFALVAVVLLAFELLRRKRHRDRGTEVVLHAQGHSQNSGGRAPAAPTGAAPRGTPPAAPPAPSAPTAPKSPTAAKPDADPRKRRGATRSAAAALLLLLVVAAAPARGQSAWARADRALVKGKLGVAETLYTQRIRRGGPDDVRVNRATVAGLLGRTEGAERELSRLSGSAGRAGEAARYNLGTLQAERGANEDALAALRRALEAKPNDAEARWNYEVVARRIDEERRHPDDPKKKPPDSGGGSGGGGEPKPNPSQPQPSQPQPQQAPPSQGSQGPSSSGPGGHAEGMTKEQADRLLNALQELARADRQKRQPVRAVNEKRGKDW